MTEFEEYNKVVMHVLVATDGMPQVLTLGYEPTDCIGIITLLHGAGIGPSFDTIMESGFTMEKVEVTIKRIEQ